jgi:hypothetical protein
MSQPTATVFACLSRFALIEADSSAALVVAGSVVVALGVAPR